MDKNYCDPIVYEMAKAVLEEIEAARNRRKLMLSIAQENRKNIDPFDELMYAMTENRKIESGLRHILANTGNVYDPFLCEVVKSLLEEMDVAKNMYKYAKWIMCGFFTFFAFVVILMLSGVIFMASRFDSRH